MITPGEAGAWVVQNLWIIALILWICVLFGVGGTIYAFIQWSMKGVKQIFNPVYIIIMIVLVAVTIFAATYIQGIVSGWFQT